MKFHLLIFVSTLFLSNINGQEIINCELGFAGLKKGELSLIQLLSDSVTFECSKSIDDVQIVGFSLTTKCDGVTRFFTNENDGLLSNAMVSNVKTLKPGCIIEFSNMRLGAKLGRKFYGYFGSEENLKFLLK